MIPRLVEVHLEVPKAEADALALRGEFGRACIERTRDRAEQAARAAGGELVTDTPPQSYVAEGSSPTLGDMVLVAMRWTVLVPEAFVPPDSEVLHGRTA